ncbi:uncharacterized protein LOC142164329 [Nicotiana tabacum]|uniref:Uncharacterized protein LOC142164329 n=1 Tax=Nicotiana tabacum TaxID=4097 RepID=A0AC58S0B1_TOBAC
MVCRSKAGDDSGTLNRQRSGCKPLRSGLESSEIRSPFEVLYARPPALAHLKAFGWLCYVVNLPKGDKFIARAKAAVFLGYSVTQRGTVHDMERLQDHKAVDYELYEEEHSDGTHVGSESVDIVTDRYPEPEAACGHFTSILEGIPGNCHILEGIPESNTSQGQEDTNDVHDHTEDDVSDYTEQTLRKSIRIAKSPLWLQNYVTRKRENGATLHTLADCISYDHVSERYKSYLAQQSVLTEPQGFKEACQYEKWIDTMKIHINALEDNNTREVVDLSKGKKVIGSKWIYKIKYKANGDVERYKARLVKKEYNQKEGLDYHEIFH